MEHLTPTVFQPSTAGAFPGPFRSDFTALRVVLMITDVSSGKHVPIGSILPGADSNSSMLDICKASAIVQKLPALPPALAGGWEEEDGGEKKRKLEDLEF